MSGPQKRTPPGRTGRVTKELPMGSTQGYERSTDETRQSIPKSPTAEEPIHWARRADRSVISCRQDEGQVILINHHDCGWWIVHRRKSGVVTIVRRFSTKSEGEAEAELVARRIGLDPPGFEGPWRSHPPTPNQVTILRRMRIPLRSNITKGEAGDAIALTIAGYVDLDRVIAERSMRS
jgi:hypothetical protein